MAKGTVNKVILIGRLGADPEVRYMPNGTAVAELRLATNEVYKDKQTGQPVEQTEWHRVTVFGAMGENAGKYLQKGRMVYIEGRIRTDKWKDQQTGQDRYSTKIIANEMQFLADGGARTGGASTATAPAGFADDMNQTTGQTTATKPAFAGKAQSAAQPAAVESFEQRFEDDEIPF